MLHLVDYENQGKPYTNRNIITYGSQAVNNYTVIRKGLKEIFLIDN